MGRPETLTKTRDKSRQLESLRTRLAYANGILQAATIAAEQDPTMDNKRRMYDARGKAQRIESELRSWERL